MRTLTVTLEDLEGIPHGTVAAGTTLSVTARYSREVILTDGTIIPPAIKVADLPGTGVASFEVYESDSTLVDPDYRDFAIVVEATVTDGPRRRGVTFRRTVKVLTSTSPVGEPVPLGTLPSTEGLPAKWTSISDLMGELSTTVATEVNDPTSAAHQAVGSAAVATVEGELVDPASPIRQSINDAATADMQVLVDQNAQTLTAAQQSAADAQTALAAQFMTQDEGVATLISDPIAGPQTHASLRARAPVVNVRDYGAKGDAATDDTVAIRAALAATPAGGTLLFPRGYYKVTQQGADSYILRLTQAKRLVGQGSGSVIMLSNTIPATTDVFLVQPTPGSNSAGYGIAGLHVAAEGSALGVARHAIHLDLTLETARVSNSVFSDNILGPTGGRSFKLTNPVNTDGFFTSRISGNLIWSGVEMERCGDSVNILQNVMAGWNSLDVSLVDGSNTLVIAYNNITCRGGIRIRSGHNIKIAYNNIEAGYADATGSNSALLDIDGSEVTESWGLLAVEVHGNNFTYRTTAPDGINAIRINKARSAVIDGNHLAHKASSHVVITSLASETILGYNLYSSVDPAGIIVDDGSRTVRKDTPRLSASGAREMWAYTGAAYRTDATDSIARAFTQTWDPKAVADVMRHHYVWDEANTFTSKHRIATQRRSSSGVFDAAKTVATLADGYMYFEPNGLALMDSAGFRWRITVSTGGVLSATRL